MPKDIKFSDSARASMFKGIEKVAKTVTVTMGPKGRNVILEKGFGGPQVTNDGVTIAKEIELEDRFENMGADLVKEAAGKTNDIAGDGTTTATLLTYALAKEGLRSIRTGINAVELKNGMQKAGMLVSEELEKNSSHITTKEEIAQVASISAQDREVGIIIAEAMEKVGNEGVISVEEGQALGLSVEITEGMEFDGGFVSPYMVTNPEKMISEMKDAPILITDEKISNMKDLLPLLEAIVQSGKKDLAIIADDITGEALTTIVLNRMKGVLNIVAVKAPGFGDKKKEYLQDLAILTGATLMTKDLGFKLENAHPEYLGSADNFISAQKKTRIIGGRGDRSRIKARIEELKMLANKTESEFEREKLAERIAKLGSGVAVIKVGAFSEIEMKEKKLRIEDALNATRAGVEEGIVAGGGVALLKASKALKDVSFANEDQNIGAQIVAQALSYPIKQIAENSGKEASVIANEVINNDNVNYGYDAGEDIFTDMIEAGIIDPKKVERVALEEAISLAGMFLTTEAAVVNTSKDEPQLPPQMGMPGMM